MKYVLLAIFSLGLLGVAAQVNRKVCISVDDLPLVKYGIEEEGHELMITEGIVGAFKNHNATGIGFVNADKLFSNGEPDPKRIAFLETWLTAGLDLGNHTSSHLNYHRVSFDTFAQDILDGERLVKELVERHGREYNFFRHPYLRSGNDLQSTEALSTFLQKHGYQEAFVTIDDDDYLFALAYARAYRSENTEQMAQIGSSYIEYMEAKLVYFEKASMDLFGRNINHTLLIHANLLNAHFLDQLMASYEEAGYTFISQGEAVSDPAYQTPVTKFDDWGISWIHRWGLSAGKQDDFFQDDPSTPKFIIELAD